MNELSSSGAGRRAGDAAGFMYLEVLVSLALLSFGLLSIGPTTVLAAQENAAARDQTFATSVAHDRAEALKRLHHDLLVDGEDVVTMASMTFD